MESALSFVVGLLTAALSLLGLVEKHPELPQESRERAVAVPTLQSSKAMGTNEISFAAPTGYHVEEDWYAKQDPTWPEVSGIDKQFMILKNEYWERYLIDAPTGGPKQITISFYRNPQNLTVQQWLDMRGEAAGGSVTYDFKDRTGVRYIPSPGQHHYDAIAVRHKDWIVQIHNAHDGPADAQNQIFEQLLASIEFAY